MPVPVALVIVAAVVGIAWGGDAAADPGRRPNVIFILTDDQGWGDAGFAGHPFAKTPHLDRLAREGTWFRQFYVAGTVCSPSRAAFMTGRVPARHLIHGHFATDENNRARSMPNWLDPGVTTLPALLRQAGSRIRMDPGSTPSGRRRLRSVGRYTALREVPCRRCRFRAPLRRTRRESPS